MRASARLVCVLLFPGVAACTPRSVPYRVAEPAGDPCDAATTTLALRTCAATALEEAEQRLAAAVDALRARGAPGEALEAAQAAWRTWRGRDCALEGRRYDGGSLQGLVVTTCLAERTRERTARLDRLFREP